MAGTPILSSNLPQMMKVIDDYNVGKYVDPDDENSTVEAINSLINDEDKLKQYKENCIIAAKELNWEREFNKFEKIHLN